jgi:flagellar hook-length control protein FliK
MTIPLVPNGTAVPAIPKSMAETSVLPTSENTHLIAADIEAKEPAFAEFLDSYMAEAENAPAREVKTSAKQVAEDAKTSEITATNPVRKSADVSDHDKVTDTHEQNILAGPSQQRSSSKEFSQPTVATDVTAQLPKQQVPASTNGDQQKLVESGTDNLNNSDGIAAGRINARTSQTEAAFNAQGSPQNKVPKTVSGQRNQQAPADAEIASTLVKHSGATLLTRPPTTDAASKMQAPETMASKQKQPAAPLSSTFELTGQSQNQSKPAPSAEAISIAQHSKITAKSADLGTATFVRSNDRRPTSDVTFNEDGPLLAKPPSSQVKADNSAISSRIAAQALVSTANQNNGDPSLSLLTPSDAPESMSWDQIRSTASTQLSTTPLKAELAPHVARQIGEAMTQASQWPTEIALSPKELGRVQMSVIADDGAVTINILTERPETLDLMRRHIDQLGQTLRSMGYESINFAFGHGTQGDEASDNNTQHASSDTDSRTPQENKKSVEDANPVIHITTASTQGVDIRL